ncbi:MAG TPA: type IV secretory system conjugative DNA transfer family protein [Acidimicrobiales bacterium]|nr:type IV secretory system conjugative DNA transfer family protein [Acidimicrobiales bacterium]
MRSATAGGQGLVLGRSPGGWVRAGPEEAVLVLGPPRSGKTSAVVVPNVLAASGPVLSTSTKPDVLAATVAARSRVGRCFVYDPTGVVGPHPEAEPLRWSPVAAAQDWDRALTMTAAMVGAARPARGVEEATHWTERAGALLAPLLHAAHLGGLDMRQLLSWVNRRQAAPAVEILAGAGEPAALACDLLSGIISSEDRELSAIWSTASGVLSAYRSEAALASTDQPNFDPAALVESADTVYVCAPGQHQAAVAPLVVGLVDSVRAARYQAAVAGGDAPALLLMLDEAANIAPLPQLPAMVSEGGGQGLLTTVCLQDLSQARSRWGAAADGFLTLFGTKLLLAGIADTRTLAAVSALAGDTDVAVSSTTSAGWRRRRSRTWASRRQPVLAVDEIRAGQPGCALVMQGDRPPGWVGLTPWYRDRHWQALADPTRTAALGRARGAGLARPDASRSLER